MCGLSLSGGNSELNLYFSGLAILWASGDKIKSKDLKKSIEFAQKCASKVVGKRGVVTI